MTATASSPQVMRDRLLQAIDGQSNICNTVTVVEVFSLLEKYPITREVLEETRLGKLVNDVRRKTKNPDVAKKAKKLLLTWQKFIEPEQGDTNGLSCVSATPVTLPVSKVGSELKDRSDFNNCHSVVGKNHSSKKQLESTPTKKSKVAWINGLDVERPNKIPVIKPPSAQEEVVLRTHCRPPSPQQTTADLDRPNLRPESDRMLVDSSYSIKHPGLSLQAVYCGNGTRGKKRKRKRSEQSEAEFSSDSKTTKRGLKFNPVTGQIESLFQQSPSRAEEPQTRTPEPHNRNVHAPYDPLKQVVYKDLSHSEVIQSYLRQQSSLLNSGNRAIGSDLNNHQSATVVERHQLVVEPPATDFPGVSREVTRQDTDRLHGQNWSGVNGCYDNKGNWYDWTKGIALDLHGDEVRLNILPYICLD